MEHASTSQQDISRTIISLERAALDRWGKGDPDGFLELAAEQVVYFDPYLPHRLDGKQALTSLYEQIRGQVQLEGYELIGPHVEATGDMAVLTFQFLSRETDGTQSLWNCTEVYRLINGEWKIVHTHWSYTQPTPG